MNFVLIAAVLLLSGNTDSNVAAFNTEAECLKELPNVAANVIEYNASGAEDKVVKFTAACLPLQKVSQGREI